MTEVDELRRVADRLAISDVVLQYATAADRRDWALYRDCFTDTVDIDFTSFSGGEPERLSADAWVLRVRGLLPGFDVTQHNSSNHVHSISGDSATCVSYMVAEHIYLAASAENYVTLGGYYTNSLVRTPFGWRICKCQLNVTWQRGNAELFALAAERAAEILAGME
jgi:hypothetical protein